MSHNSACAQGKIDSLKQLLDKHRRDTVEVNILNLLSQAFYYSDNDSSKIYANEAAALADKIGYKKGGAYAFHNVGVYHLIRSELDSALVNFEKSLLIKNEIEDAKSLSGTLNNLGSIFYKKGNYAKALSYFQQSLKLKLAFGDSLRAARTLNNIGLIYKNQKNYNEALNSFNQSLEIKRSFRDSLGEASALSNIGLIHMEQKNYEKALVFYQRSYQIYDLLREKCLQLSPAANIGAIYFELGQIEEALSLLQLTYARAVACEDQANISYTLLNMGGIYAKQGLNKEAEEAMLESYQIANLHDLKAKTQGAASELYRFYKAVGSTEKALEFLEISKQLQDELFNKELTEQLATIKLNYEFDQERDSLEYQKESELFIINSQLERQRIKQYLAIIGLLIALTLAIVIYRYYQLSQKTKSILQKKNQAISEALNEREVLLSEVHHRVKNNLQIISSFLNVQSKYLQDELAKNAVLEGRNRVQSMALVHEKLYQSESMSHLNVKEYLQELVSTLFQSYDVSEDRVKLSTKIEYVDLSVDATIHIGLIINELISNALKYAFPENKNGTVSLVLIKKQELHELEVSDDGIGISSADDLFRSYGYRIIRSLSKGLNGSISIEHKKGTTFKLTF